MSIENPFAKKPAKKEEEVVDTSWVDLAEGKVPGKESNAEVSPAEIESAESGLTESITRLEEAMKKPTVVSQGEELDSEQKEHIISVNWEAAKRKATIAFGLLVNASLGAFIWTDQTWQSLQHVDAGNFEAQAQLSQRFAELQTATPSIMAAAIAVPAIMLGISKLSKMRGERNLNNPATA